MYSIVNNEGFIGFELYIICELSCSINRLEIV